MTIVYLQRAWKFDVLEAANHSCDHILPRRIGQNSKQQQRAKEEDSDQKTKRSFRRLTRATSHAPSEEEEAEGASLSCVSVNLSSKYKNARSLTFRLSLSLSSSSLSFPYLSASHFLSIFLFSGGSFVHGDLKKGITVRFSSTI